ncbi:MAG: hypothetical protein WBC48_01970 [Minisyncoccales bacterium]
MPLNNGVSYFSALINNWPFIAAMLFYVFIAYELSNGKKIGWYFGLLFFPAMILVQLIPLIEIMGRKSYETIFLLGFLNLFGVFFLGNLLSMIFLLRDRKNYFAAVEKARNKTA